MKTVTLDAPQLGEDAWHSLTADETIASESRAHRDQIEAAVAAHAPDFDWSRARLLELGAYRHFTGHLLAAERGAASFVTDIAAAALRNGCEQARASGVAVNATPVVADFHDLPFASDWFDVVFVAASVHHTRRPEAVLREMLRVLRPSGLLVIAKEPCARACCFHAFHSNRLESMTPFESALNDAGLLATLSSPFWGARPENLFGMVENDRIPLSLYMETFAESGTVVERTLAEHALVGPFEQKLTAIVARGAALRAEVRSLLRSAVAAAAANFGETERMLGYRLPTECEIHELAQNVAALLELRKTYADDAEWSAQMFGAALTAVVRKRPGPAQPSTGAFRREMAVEADGLVRERPDSGALAAGLSAPLLPDIQTSDDGAALEPWFPREHWQFVREDSGLRNVANLVSHARIEISPCATRTLLVLRYFAIVSNGRPYHVRIWGGGRLLDEQLIVLQESRLVRAWVPEGCGELIVDVASDEDNQLVDAPWRVRINVCQLFAVA